jgi:hypothetical protein
MNGATGWWTRRRIIVAVAVLLPVVALAAWLLRETVGATLADPLLRAAWRTRILARLPESDLWIALIVIGVINVVWVIVRGNRLPAPEAPRIKRGGRVSYWLDLLEVSRRSRRLLIKPLRLLLIKIVAYYDQSSFEAARTSLQTGQHKLARPVQRVLFSQGRYEVDANARAAAPLPQEIVDTIQEMERYMDVSDE